jgi:hypothetical protein
MPNQSSHDLPANPMRTLFDQVSKSAWFKEVLGRAQQQQSLQTLFDQECPLELMGKCRVLGIKEAYLMVGVDNAGLATQLQYRTRELLMALKKYPEFLSLKKIYVKVIRAS